MESWWQLNKSLIIQPACKSLLSSFSFSLQTQMSSHYISGSVVHTNVLHQIHISLSTSLPTSKPLLTQWRNQIKPEGKVNKEIR